VRWDPPSPLGVLNCLRACGVFFPSSFALSLMRGVGFGTRSCDRTLPVRIFEGAPSSWSGSYSPSCIFRSFLWLLVELTSWPLCLRHTTKLLAPFLMPLSRGRLSVGTFWYLGVGRNLRSTIHLSCQLGKTTRSSRIDILSRFDHSFSPSSHSHSLSLGPWRPNFHR
jgi:hypothetical protein